MAIKTARVIEQGLGRSVRGERDYSVIIITGGDLVKHLRGKESRQYFSDQTRTQLEIGLQASALAKEEAEKTKQPIAALRDLASQCLNRDEGWKAFYAEQMNSMPKTKAAPKMLKVFADEYRAEHAFQNGAVDQAVKIIQNITDTYVTTKEDRGWYLQEMARYRYADSVAQSNDLQLNAHKMNRNLLKPKNGLIVAKIVPVSQQRMSRIIAWVQQFGSYDDLNVAVQGILDNLRFGVDSDKFERALDDVGTALGFETQRPDHDWGVGPDNLWGIRAGEFVLWECKSEVLLSRDRIYKEETGQMANSSGWFKKQYPGASVRRIMIIPTATLGPGATCPDPVEIMREAELKALVANVAGLFKELRLLNLKSLDELTVQKLVNQHQLSDDDILTKYGKAPKG